MIIKRTPEFDDDYKNRLSRKEQKQMDKALRFLAVDIRHPALNIKKTQGKLLKGIDNVFEGRVNKNYRFLFLIEEDYYDLLYCGSHDYIYKLHK